MDIWIEKGNNFSEKQSEIINVVSEKYKFDTFVASLICERNHFELEEIDYYLASTFKPISPKGLKDMDKAIECIFKHMKQNNKILNISDWDLDGTAGRLTMHYTFKAFGYKNFNSHIPNRKTETYGLSSDIVKRAHKDNVKLIITTDNGIASFDAIDTAIALGIDVIVTDHHEIQTRKRKVRINDKFEEVEELVPATVIINPHRNDDTYKYKNLSGGGVAYKLSQALIMSAPKKVQQYFLENGYKEKVICFAAISAIGDVMDIIGENRALVKEALKLLDNNHVPAVNTFLDTITVSTLTYSLIPIVNSMGRLVDMNKSFELLLENNLEKLNQLKDYFIEINEQRKTLVANGIEETLKIIDKYEEIPPVIIEILPDGTDPTVLGLIAGKVKERIPNGEQRPIILFSSNKPNGYKGSGRSIESYNMFQSIEPHLHLIAKGGGHPMACGLNADTEEQILAFKNAVLKDCKLTKEDFIQKIYIDKYVDIDTDIEKLYSDLQCMEPFAKMNPYPILAMKNVFLDFEYKTYKNGEFASICISSDSSDTCLDGVCWNSNTYLIEGKKIFEPKLADIIFELTYNDYKKTINLNIKSIKFIEK